MSRFPMSSFVVRRSSFVVRRSSFVVRRFVVRRSSFGRHSSFGRLVVRSLKGRGVELIGVRWRWHLLSESRGLW